MHTITRQACPACAKCEGVPLIFGFPHGEDFERQERGEVILAGCVVDSDSDMQCRSCDFQWSSLREVGEKVERGTVEKPTATGLGLQSRERVGEPSVRDAAVTRRSATQPRRSTPKVSLTPTISVFLATMIATSFLVGAVACSDGWASGFIGRSGACSHHGGVNHLPGTIRLLFSLFVAWYFHLWRSNRAQMQSARKHDV
ncbi:hypothetical protein BX589_126130 [Paraburkholderia fungorum]|nr:hypothetical protein BX589_126130 [Paraburkholderia fungorum]